jgi:four helix bundle protein
MTSINRFEDLEVWKLTFDIANIVYDLTLKEPFCKDFALRDQIRRSAVSVFSNIAEGFERDGNREFVNFLSIAKGSCGELRAQAIFAYRRKYISEADMKELSEKLVLAGNQIAAFQRYLRSSELKGRKFA